MSNVKTKQKQKKLILKIAFLTALVLAVLWAIVFAIEKAQDNTVTPDVIQTSDDYLTKSFRNYYPVDFDADLSLDEEYLSLDANIHYTEQSGNNYVLRDVSTQNKHEGQLFFEKYFDIAISGKFEEYSDLFTKTYKKDTPGFEKYPSREFPPQRIYNISIKELARTDANDTSFTYEKKPCVFGFYEVSFMILKNDGCFRRDLPENATRPLIFELVTFDIGTQNEKTYIKNLYTPESLVSASESDTK